MPKFKAGDKVRVVSVQSEGLWYADKIGKEFTVGSYTDGEFYLVEEAGPGIWAKDLELVTTPKTMLKNGMRVKCRNGNMYTVVDGALLRPADTKLKLSWVSINDLGKDLLAVNPKDPAWDVMEVYEKPRLVVEYFEYYAPTEVIWQREEKTSKQLQLEALQKQAQDVVDAIKKLQDEE